MVCDHSYCDCPRCCCSNQGDNLKCLPFLPFENQKQNIEVHYYSHRELTFQSRIKKETKNTEIKSVLTDNQVDMINIFIIILFSQASERAGIPNPKIWLANNMLVMGLAFYDMAHGLDFSPQYLNFAPKS